jgi:hypothetical protein
VISDYVALPGGYVLLGVAAIALAVAVGLLAAALRPAGLADASAPVALHGTASGGLVVAAVFPTNDLGTSAGFVADLHRLAGLVVLVALPVGAWMVARRAARTASWRASAPVLGWAAGAVGLLSAAFLMGNVVPIVISDSPFFTGLGALQRVLYAMVMVVLLLLARATRTAVAAARTAPALRGMA